jgi:hypothetical protein
LLFSDRMRQSTSILSLSIFIALGACADDPYEPEIDVCDEAAHVLVTCGATIEQSPFGTCQPEQHELASQLLDIYTADGCAGIADAKADSWTCTLMPFLCVDHTVSELEPFVTDGCSMFPDGTASDPTRWQECCVVHDYAYYVGGSEAAREAADRALQTCIRDKTNQALADLMYYGVRAGGTPALPTPWRWGYGWAYDPLDGYRDLPAAQATAAAARVAAHRLHPVAPAALEQRLRKLADAIATVPGLETAIEQINAVIAAL